MTTKQPLKRLTASRAATVGPGDYTADVQGLQLRVRAKRTGHSRTWYFRYKWRGEPVRLLLGHLPELSMAEAADRLVKLRKSLIEGIDPRKAAPRRNPTATPALPDPISGAPPDGHSIEYLVAEFMARFVRPKRKRPEYAEGILNRYVLPQWKGRDARTIEPEEVLTLLDGITDRGRLVMANRVADLLGQLFKFGIHRRIVKNTPVQLLFRPGGEEKPRDRSLSDEELKALLADPHEGGRFERLYRVIRVLLLTGQRRGELALARWEHVDIKDATWSIPDENSKTGKGHVVPLSKWAVEEFRALKREAEKSPWVLPGTDLTLHIDPKLLTRSVARGQDRFKASGIAAFTLHDLRRTCRTGLAKLKIPPHIAERVLNHAQEKIAGTYDTHDYIDEKREALEKWAKHLEDLIK